MQYIKYLLVINAIFLINIGIQYHVEMVQDLGPPGCCPPNLCIIMLGPDCLTRLKHRLEVISS
jgi:hypothetical protein